MIEITEVRISGTARGNFLGYAEVVLGGAVVLKNMKIIAHRLRDKPPMVMMPCVPLANGSQFEVYHPISRGFRNILEAAVLAAFSRRMAGVHE